MNGDITPPRRSPEQQAATRETPEPPRSAVSPDMPPSPSLSLSKPPKRRRLRPLYWVLIGLAVLLLIVPAGTYGWYQWSLQSICNDGKARLAVMSEVTIEPGMTPEQIGDLLEERGFIRSALSFVAYTRLAGVHGSLQSGKYQSNGCESVSEWVKQMTGGNTEQLKITFYPGATLRDPTDTPDSKRTDVYTMLRRAGFSESEIDAALAKNYSHPLFAGKPAGTSLEGYIYGETYQFAPGATVEEILTHTFDIYYQQLQQHNIVERAKKRGLTLYQAITLASIIEREVHSATDQKQVAQVFYKRLADNMTLGSDVTFIYAAEQQNKTPTVDFASPYNTRLHTGLPPGPIATPGITALEAVADPAKGDYVYFIAGDDGKTYFAYTAAEHQENIDKHCQKLCFE